MKFHPPTISPCANRAIRLRKKNVGRTQDGLPLWALPLVLAFLATVAGAALMSGCSTETRYRVLSALFDDVPKPGTETPHKQVVRSQRRTPPPPPKPVLAFKPPPARPDWGALLRKLPRTATGEVDWDGALAQKLIEPKSGLAKDAPDQVVFDMNVELIPNGQPLFKVIFPHSKHTEWLTCANCHPGIFQMQKGADPITMAKIFSGEYCGRCHSKVAYAVATGCPRCHLALAGPQ